MEGNRINEPNEPTGGRGYFEIPKRNRKDDAPITLFMGSISKRDGKMPIYCMFCKLQVFGTRNKIIYAVDNEGYYEGKKSSSTQQCKRCGQTYHLVV